MAKHKFENTAKKKKINSTIFLLIVMTLSTIVLHV